VLFNAMVSTSLAADVRTRFVRHVDELTPSHVQLLRYFADPVAYLGRDVVEASSVYAGGSRLGVEMAFPEWAGQQSLVSLIAADLEREQLLGSAALNTMMTKDGVFSVLIAPLGR